MAEEADLILFQGESAQYPVVVTNGKKVPIPITGFDLAFLVKVDISDDDVDALIIKKSAGLSNGSVDQIQIVDDGSVEKRGKALINIGGSETRPLKIDTLYATCLCLVKPSSDFFKIIFQGSLLIREGGVKGPVT
jgi:hypothetical protein